MDALKEIGALSREAWRSALRNPGKAIAFLALVAVVAALILPRGRAWLEAAQLDPATNPGIHEAAAKISEAGEFHYANLWVAILLFAAGAARKRIDWKRAALACFAAGAAAGILVNVLRPAFGRPRPSTGIEDQFYLMEFTWEYNAFPSGHAMSNFAAGAALAIAAPPVGVPYLLFAGAVGWSRLQRDRHDPADVTAGALLGTGVGALFGFAARSRSRSGLQLGWRP